MACKNGIVFIMVQSKLFNQLFLRIMFNDKFSTLVQNLWNGVSQNLTYWPVQQVQIGYHCVCQTNLKKHDIVLV